MLRASPLPAEDGDLIGVWLTERGFPGRVAIFARDGAFWLQTMYGDGSVRVVELAESPNSPLGRHVVALPDQGHGEYLVVSVEGQLEHRDSDGAYQTSYLM